MSEFGDRGDGALLGSGERMTSLESRLTLRHFRLIDAIAREGNLVRAAQRLNMTQSALTKALQEVELLVQVELFKRTNRGALPTPSGEALASHARIVIAQLRHASHSRPPRMRCSRKGNAVL